MTENGNHRVDHTRFKWIVVASLIALIMVLATVEDLVR